MGQPSGSDTARDTPAAGSWIGAIVLGVAILALWATGLLAELVQPERIRRVVEAAGSAAPLAFIALLVPLNLVFLAGLAIWISPSIFPLPLAILYSTVGAVVASAGSLVIGHFLGNEWARARVPKRLHRFEKRLEAKPVRTVFVLRTILWMNPGVDLLLAVLGVRWRDYLVGTVFGMVLPTGLRVYVGYKGFEVATGSSPWLIVVAVSFLVLVVVLRRRSADAT